MNSRAANSWLRMLGLCPLLAIDLALYDALLFGVALLAVLLFTNTALAILQRWLIQRQRLAAIALLAAMMVGIFDLLLQAFCYAHAQHLQYYLPLLIIPPLLFYRRDAGSVIKLSCALSESLFCGSAFLCSLAIAALLRAVLPAEIAIATGLLCGALLSAIANKIAPVPVVNDTAATLPRARARVTGPVR